MQTAIEKFNDIKKQYPHWIFNEEPKKVMDTVIGYCNEHKHNFPLCINSFSKQGGCPECRGRKRRISTKERIIQIQKEYPEWIFKSIPTKDRETVECFCKKHQRTFNLNIKH